MNTALVSDNFSTSQTTRKRFAPRPAALSQPNIVLRPKLVR
jgi:hypothetical protein